MRIYIENQGCTANKAYSEMLSGILKSKHDIVNNVKDADLIIINSCALKTPTENAILREIKYVEKNYPKKKIQVIGCLPKAFPEHPKLKKFFNMQTPIDKKGVKLGFPRIRKNKLIGIVPVSEGCLNNCSFCAGKLAKGNLFSYPENQIIDEIKNALKEGCKEIYITSQDMGCYGFDRRTNIIDLLKKVVSIERDFWIRIGMMNPNHVLKFLNELINIYKNKKIYKFLHIPVQSGSDRILKLMNRTYKVKDFEKIVKSFRKEIPDITISTDIIVGFPGETEKDFQKSFDLVEKIRPDVLNITRYWPRKKTRGAELPNQLHSGDKKERSRKITELFDKITVDSNKKWIGKETEVLINSKGKYRNQYKGRNIFYKPVVVKSKNNILGKKILVKIKDVSESSLIGDLELKEG
ncbi:MAG: tRNA (N(6)-L-threonylcarbamoyladenosine(37)-C(2))-methylthiotransferase [Candidatus Woesearchaeota archaeon]|nr:MAG: tRNA (N(6)-L-threonylcarbamoyladenosine(37)-C(2))-methylthiotransferase [Candidatus Woesearchaeota archaeon]